MSENKDKDKDKDKDKTKDKEKDKNKEIDRVKCNSSSSFSTIAAIASLLSSPTTDNATSSTSSTGNINNSNSIGKMDKIGKFNNNHNNNGSNLKSAISDEFLLKPPTTPQYKTSLSSLESEVFALDLETGDLEKLRQFSKDETSATVGTQRVYKKTSPNSILTMYLPSREIISCGTQPSILKGILFVDSKSIQGYRVYAQLTLTFRYGREDEEVMGLRFCNEAIMSLYQIYPRTDDPKRDSLTPLQDALIKRLGIGAYPFTLSLSPQSPPSVQLVPAKRYYGAPIGTSYDVRCFIADKTEDKFHRKATVKMGVRVIHKTDVFLSQMMPENFTALLNNPLSPPPPISPTITKNLQTSTNISINTINSTPTSEIQPSSSNQSDKLHNNPLATTSYQSSFSNTTTGNEIHQHLQQLQQQQQQQNASPSINPNDVSCSSSIISRLTLEKFNLTGDNNQQKSLYQQFQQTHQQLAPTVALPSTATTIQSTLKSKKQERVDSFPKIRLSPKSFRFSGRFGRSKSEVERTSTDPFYNYSKSFHEVLDFSKPEACGPQGAVDKPFLLQEGRVCLRASLNKSWYTHGENVIITVNIRNESKKTVRKIRVCAIQHVDVCMFNNGKFKNVVADSDNNNLPSDQTTVGPGKTLNTTIILKPKRGPTKNWIALEDSLQRCSEPDEIVGDIAASAVRMPTINAIGSSPSSTEDRNVFAIYVSYYVKVKLTLSGMGGELSLKLPFSLVHIGSSSPDSYKTTITTTTLSNTSTTQSTSTTVGTSTTKTTTTNELNNKIKQIDKPISIIKANSTGTTNNNSSGQQTAKDKSSVFSRQAKGHASDDDIIDIEEDYDSIRTDNSKCYEHYGTAGGCSGGGSCGGGGGNNNNGNSSCCNKNIHSLERIDSIEDEIPIQIPNKNLAKRRLTRSDIRVKDSSQEDNDDDDDDDNNITTTQIIDAIIHSTIKIPSDEIEVHAHQHSIENETLDSSSDNIVDNIIADTHVIPDDGDDHHHQHDDNDEIIDKNKCIIEKNIKDNINRLDISDGNDLVKQCDINKKTIQPNDNNSMPINIIDESISEHNNAISISSITTSTSTTTTTIEATAQNNNINKQQHNIQTTCAQIHTPHDS